MAEPEGLVRFCCQHRPTVGHLYVSARWGRYLVCEGCLQVIQAKGPVRLVPVSDSAAPDAPGAQPILDEFRATGTAAPATPGGQLP